MTLHEFIIVASGLDPTADDFETRFYEAGCDDATVSFQKGHIILDFAREAEDAVSAIGSAIQNVTAAGASVDRIEPDPLVSLSDIAARTHLTRAAISLYARGERGAGFPAPIVRVTSDSPLWDWAEVSRWLHGRNQVSRETVEFATVVEATNRALAAGRRPTTATIREVLKAG